MRMVKILSLLDKKIKQKKQKKPQRILTSGRAFYRALGVFKVSFSVPKTNILDAASTTDAFGFHQIVKASEKGMMVKLDVRVLWSTTKRFNVHICITSPLQVAHDIQIACF